MVEIPLVIVRPRVMCSDSPSFFPKLPKTFLCLCIFGIQININIPNLRIFVGFLQEVQLLLEFFSFDQSVFTLGVDGSSDNSIFFIHQNLSAYHFVVIEGFPSLLRFNLSFFQNNASFSIMLVLGVLDFIIYLVLLVNYQCIER